MAALIQAGRMPSAPARPDSRAAAVAGAVSGTFAVAATYPLDLIRTRQALDRRVPPRSTFAALRGVLREEGGRALFRGLRPAVLSHAPAGAIFFTLYTRTQAYVPVQSRSGQFAASAGFAWCVTCLTMNPMWVVKVCDFSAYEIVVLRCEAAAIGLCLRCADWMTYSIPRRRAFKLRARASRCREGH